MKLSKDPDLFDVDNAVACEDGKVHWTLKQDSCAPLYVCALTGGSLRTRQHPYKCSSCLVCCNWPIELVRCSLLAISIVSYVRQLQCQDLI